MASQYLNIPSSLISTIVIASVGKKVINRGTEYGVSKYCDNLA